MYSSCDLDERSSTDVFMKEFKAFRQLKNDDEFDVITPQDAEGIQDLVSLKRLKVS